MKFTRRKKIADLGRSIVLDILAVDTEGRLYNLEVQRDPRGARPKRARLHGAFIDVHTAKKGGDFEETPECYIIFITETDVLGYGELVYTIQHTIKEVNHAKFNDGQTFIYLNCSAKDDGSPAWKLAHDMKCADLDKILIPEIAETMRDTREEAPLKLMKGDGNMNEHTRPVDKKMLRFIKDYFRDEIAADNKRAKEKGIQEGKEIGIRETITRAIKAFLTTTDLTFKAIAENLGVSLAEVEAVAKTLGR